MQGGILPLRVSPSTQATRVRSPVAPGCFVAVGVLFLLLQSVGRAAQHPAAPRALCSPPTPRVGTVNGRAARFFRSRIPHDTQSVSTWNSTRVVLSGDVQLNPGPDGQAAPSTNQQRNRPISVISQNVRSLRNKLHTLRPHNTELEACNVIAMTETWLSSDIADSELQVALPGHLWFRRDRPTHGGGVACAVRDQTDCIYTDFSAAFQCVDHSLLFHKLQNSFKGNNPPSSFFLNIVNDFHNTVFHSLFRNTTYLSN